MSVLTMSASLPERKLSLTRTAAVPSSIHDRFLSSCGGEGGKGGSERLHHGDRNYITRLHHGYTTAPSRLHHSSITAPSRLHHGSITAPSRRARLDPRAVVLRTEHVQDETVRAVGLRIEACAAGEIGREHGGVVVAALGPRERAEDTGVPVLMKFWRIERDAKRLPSCERDWAIG